jgi:hypothetical protein
MKRGAVAWAEAALGQPPWGARGDFSALLDGMAELVRGSLSSAAERSDTAAVARGLEALRLIDVTREGVGTNVNPQLALAVLARGLERVA